MSTSLMGSEEKVTTLARQNGGCTGDPEAQTSAPEAETHSTGRILFCSSLTIILAMAAGASGRRSLK